MRRVRSPDRRAVEDARSLLAGVVETTPVQTSRALAELVGGPVYLKCENLQRTGSFKIRGAYTRLARLSAEERARGVVAASAGNHAQGVALAAQMLGIPAVVYMPVGAALPKVAATRGYGAEVRLAGARVDESLARAAEEASRSGRVLVHPFDHPDVVAGQGTIGLEILEQVPHVRTIVVPVGGGGLAAGIAIAVDALRPASEADDGAPAPAPRPGAVRVVGVQAAGAAAYPASLAAGYPVRLEHMSTMADGIAVGLPGAVPFDVISRRVDRVMTVSEEHISRALLAMAERAKQVAEPAGAVGVAALVAEPTAFEPPVVVVLSGGNVDPLVLVNVLRHGLSAAGRYLQVRVRIPDRPGALAWLLLTLAESGANVVTISHVRTGVELLVGEADVEVELETRGRQHCGEVLEHLRGAGYVVPEPGR